jgi:hypothetical protein
MLYEETREERLQTYDQQHRLRLLLSSKGYSPHFLPICIITSVTVC